jgi:hypothetical protein
MMIPDANNNAIEHVVGVLDVVKEAIGEHFQNHLDHEHA